jgi:hypothetical protein
VITSKDPKGITDMLTGTYGFKLKGMSPIGYHLACLLVETNMDSCVSPLRGMDMKSLDFIEQAVHNHMIILP